MTHDDILNHDEIPEQQQLQQQQLQLPNVMQLPAKPTTQQQRRARTTSLVVVVPRSQHHHHHHRNSEPRLHPLFQVPDRQLPLRWAVIKSCPASATSLTEEEENFLFRSLDKSRHKTNISFGDEDTAAAATAGTQLQYYDGDDPDDQAAHDAATTTTTATTNSSPSSEAARGKLLTTLRARRKTMTQKEIDFLQELAQNPELLLEQLEQANDVLEHDPLFELSQCLADMDDDDNNLTNNCNDKDNDGSSQKRDDAIAINDPPPQQKNAAVLERRRSILPDASFRRELWLHCEAEDLNHHHHTAWMDSDKDRGTAAVPPSSFVVYAPALQSTVSTDTPLLEESFEDLGSASEIRSSIQSESSLPTSNKKRHFRWGSFIYKVQESLRQIIPTPANSVSDLGKQEQEQEPDDDLGSLTFTVLSKSIQDLTESPTVLTPPLMDALRPHLPFIIRHDNFWLKYSLLRGDGFSTRTLLHNVRSSCRTIVAIETTKGDVFGSFTSSPWRAFGPGYYGSGEAFLWRLDQSRYTRCATVEDQIALERQVTVYPWSGKNRCVQCSPTFDSDLIVGGGGLDDLFDDPNYDESESSSTIQLDTTTKADTEDVNEYGLGLFIQSDLDRGFSESCLTFQSPPLVEGRDFEIANLEVWTFTPMDSLEQAEKLELSRQFIFDHGHFALS